MPFTPASPTITELFDRFLDLQRARLAPRTYTNYGYVVELFADCLNGYGHMSLDTEERAAFEEAYQQDEEAFCHLFGADKIVDGLGEFLDYFMIRKVGGGAELLRAAGTVTKKLVKWLASEGLLGDTEAAVATDHAAEAASELPKMDRLASLLYDLTRLAPAVGDPDSVDDTDWKEGSLQITRVEPGNLWFDGGVGPLAVPKEASELAQIGWSANVVLVRRNRRWHLMEVGNVYPH